jgi:hypothetical protein
MTRDLAVDPVPARTTTVRMTTVRMKTGVT